MFFKNYVGPVGVLVLLCVFSNAEGSIDGTQTNNIVAENTVVSEPEKDKEVPVLVESNRTGRSLHKECGNGIFQNAKCLKIQVLSFLEDLGSRDELNILPGLSIVKENATDNNLPKPEELAAELSRQFPGKPDEKLNRFLLYRLQEYLNRHSLRYRLLDPDTSKDAMDIAKGETDVVHEGRRRGHGGGLKGGGGLVAAAVMMKGALAAAALGGLALLAGKALGTALMALLLAALVGLKDKGGHHKTTYEIIAKPEVSHHHSHSQEEHHEHEHGHHGGYRRAYDTNYAYNSYMPYENSYTSPPTN